MADLDPARGALPRTLVGSPCFALGYAADAVINGMPDLESLGILAAALALAFLCAVVELVRRLRRTVIVPTISEIGIYRQGQLQNRVGRSQLVEYRLRIANTFRELLLFSFLGFGGAVAALTSAGGAAGGLIVPLAWSLATAVACTGLLASSIWVRVLARHYIVPKGSGRETVVLSKSGLRRAGLIA